LKGGDQPIEQALAIDLGQRGLSGPAITRLLVPVLAHKRCTVDLKSYAVLADLAKAAHGIPEPALKAAGDRLLASDGKVTAERIRREIKAAKQGGQLAVIRPGTPEWAAWQAHYFAQGDRLLLDLMDRAVSWTVPKQYPEGQP
jgi:hypothetical protein